ncbi:family 43 glycosylhydrolase [Allofournierella sp.]|uniref:family 43 glycosylhydrolase n=1 Tax=Allofournierella sp. TaxID=1940256 RepID=UPI003AB40743
MLAAYQNPIAKKGDFADPFALRWNGRYYLYCTNPDLRCWSSADLVNWRPEGPVIGPDTFPGLVPFAPEVVYSNGKFYLYTSPSGLGHYVLESEKPTGPFRRISENLGHAIDGSVFIDDDGRWYFYWAGDEGIWGCEMKSPTEFGEPVLTGAFLHGWTEGPLVRRQGDIYYMTYTGNHYLSSGYRIQTAWSRDPLRGYTDDACNPAVVCTGGGVTGLGHSSTVLGPDLVSHYMLYHNLNPDASRELDLDRQLWYGRATQVLGPTVTPQPAPGLPDAAFPPMEDVPALEWGYSGEPWRREDELFYSAGAFEARSTEAFGPCLTAEFHLALPGPEKGGRGIALEAEGGARRYELAFLRREHCVRLQKTGAGGTEVLKEAALPADHCFEAPHCLRVELAPKGLTLWVDDRRQLAAELEESGAAFRVGYFSRGGALGCGYTAVTASTRETARRTARIPAGCAFAPVFGCEGGLPGPDGSVLLREGETAGYTLWAAQAGEYELCVTGGGEEPPGGLEAALDGKALEPAVFRDTLLRLKVFLERGEHRLELTGARGGMRLARLETRPMAKGFLPPCAQPALKAGPCGKSLWGEEAAGDYAVCAELKIKREAADGRAGLLLRATQPAEGGEGADPVLGIDFFVGYSVQFTGTECLIARHQYDRRILAACPYGLAEDRWFALRAEVRGGTIAVFAEGGAAPLLTAQDACPLTHGQYGLWAENARAAARNICVTEFE